MLYRVTPTEKQRAALKYFIEGGQTSLYGAMRKAGYSHMTAITPVKLTQSRGWQQILDETFNDDMLSEVHSGLLKAKAIDHLVFPLAMTDDEITELVESVGGTVRKFMHGETANHVWFWAPNNKARQDALKLAYDLKGRIKPPGDPAAANNTYNTFIQQNNINPNAPTARELVQSSLDVLMAQTKRKVIDA